MYRNIFALTLVLGMASFAPAAWSGSLCDDDDDEIVCSLSKLIPRKLPSMPSMPMAVPGASSEAPALKVVTPPQTPAPLAKAIGGDLKAIEMPERMAMPDIAPLCKKYLADIGEMMPVPCE